MISVSSDGGRQWVSEWWMKAMHRTSPFGISIQCLASVETHAHTNIFAFEETLTMKARKYRCRSIHYTPPNIFAIAEPRLSTRVPRSVFSRSVSLVSGFGCRMSCLERFLTRRYIITRSHYGQAVYNRGCEAKAEPFRCNVTSTAV